jgi:predicted transcriptional regulator
MLVTKRVGDAYNRHALTLEIGDRVSKVVDYILTSYQPDFAVMQGNKILGIVTRDDVLRSLATQPGDMYVTGIMQREFVRVQMDLTLDQVRSVMAEKTTRTVAVFVGEEYLGLVSIDDISEALAVLAYQQRHDQLNAAAR